MKEISLSKGKFTMVDDQDFEWLNRWNWFAHKGRDNFYAVRKETFTVSGVRKRVHISMHRQILGLTDPKIFVDHVDHNGLNNQRYNLRECTILQNNMNRVSVPGSSSKYLGVSWFKPNSIWVAKIRVNGRLKHLGCFNIEIDAAKAYNEAALEYFGEFANINKI